MNLQIFDVIILPIILGFISLSEVHTSAYGQLIHRMEHLNHNERGIQSLLFIVIKSLSLAVLGIFFGLLSERFFSSGGRAMLPFENAESLFLGIFYLVIGLIGIMYLNTKSTFPTMAMMKEEHKEKLPLGISYGLIMPTGSLVFLIVLLAKALATNSAVSSMVSLFVYGLAITFPTVILLNFRTVRELSEKYFSARHPYIPVVIVLLIGFYEIVKSFL